MTTQELNKVMEFFDDYLYALYGTVSGSNTGNKDEDSNYKLFVSNTKERFVEFMNKED